MYFKLSLGGTSEAEPPVPIPNTEVKRFSTYDTALATAWENRPLPGDFFDASTIVNIEIDFRQINNRGTACFKSWKRPHMNCVVDPLYLSG